MARTGSSGGTSLAEPLAGRPTLLGRLRKTLAHNWQLYVLVALPLVYLIIFQYVPMSGRLYRQSLKYWEHVPDENLVLPVLNMTEDETDEYQALRTEILAYHNESWVKFITGDLDVDADWDEYVGTLERMGLERTLEIAQKVFDRQYG